MTATPPRDERGSFTLPMSLVVVVVATLGLGTWSLMLHWRKLAEHQLRLDACVRTQALELRGTLESLGSSSLRMKALRLGIATAPDLPRRAALTAWLTGEAIRQAAELAGWKMQQLRWSTAPPCGEAGGLFSDGGDHTEHLPDLGVEVPPPDGLGPKPAQWLTTTPPAYLVEVAHHPRAAAALVQPLKGNSPLEFTRWKSRWTTPGRGLTRSIAR